ncbi:MAG: hypothetical protein V2B19_32070 [Pseudomonadota bacterium]
MSTPANSKDVIGRLYLLWETIRDGIELPAEIAYRVDRLTQRLDAISEKMFLKTVNARQMLFDCEQLTQQLTSCIAPTDSRTYHLLTNLENHFDQLAKKTYAFRIKAG